MNIGVVFPQTEFGNDPAAIRDYHSGRRSNGLFHTYWPTITCWAPTPVDLAVGAVPIRFGTPSTSRLSCSVCHGC